MCYGRCLTRDNYGRGDRATPIPNGPLNDLSAAPMAFRPSNGRRYVMENAMADNLTDELLQDYVMRQAFHSAMSALITRANEVHEISPNMAIADMTKVGHMLHYLDPHDRVGLFDGIRARLA